MAWVHQLDSEGNLDRGDWISVRGRETPTGATRGRIELDGPDSYLFVPLWRDWGDGHGSGFPHPVRIDVVAPRHSFSHSPLLPALQH